VKRRDITKKLLFVLLIPFLLTCAEFNLPEKEETSKNPDTSKLKNNLFQIVVPGDVDPGLFLYRNSFTRNQVISFYTELTGSELVTLSIIKSADENNIPLSLAFALSWVESRFSPYAVNKNHYSIDRGLFQLNSTSFPHLTEKDFFDPEINSRYGLEYLKKCIEEGGNEIVGLAMYNAGKTRVKKGMTPYKTLHYISQIQEYRKKIEEDFADTMKYATVLARK